MAVEDVELQNRKKDIWVTVMPPVLGDVNLDSLNPFLLKIPLEATVQHVEDRLKSMARLTPGMAAKLFVNRESKHFYPDSTATVQSLQLVPYPSRDSFIFLKSPDSIEALPLGAETEANSDSDLTTSSSSNSLERDTDNQELISDIQQKLVVVQASRGNNRVLGQVLEEVNHLLFNLSVSMATETPRVDLTTSAELTPRQTTKLDRALAEIVNTERTYTACLNKMRGWMETMLAYEVNEEVVKDIFANLPVIWELNRKLLEKLELEEKQGNRIQEIILIFEEMVPFLISYSEYVQNYQVACRGITELGKNKNYAEMLKEMADGDKSGGDIKSLFSTLITPIQRIPRYEILFQAVQNHVDSSTEEPIVDKLAALVSTINKIAKRINKDQKHAERRAKVYDVQSKLRGTNLVLVNPTRMLLFESPVERFIEPNTWVPGYLFLFSDILVYTHPNKEEFDYLGQFQADVIRLEEVQGQGLFRLSSLTSIQSLTIKFSSDASRILWQQYFEKMRAKRSSRSLSSRRSVILPVAANASALNVLSSVMPVRDCNTWADLASVKECTVSLEGSVLTISRPSLGSPGMSRSITLFLETCIMHSSVASLKGTLRAVKTFEIQDSKGIIKLRFFPNGMKEYLRWVEQISGVIGKMY